MGNKSNPARNQKYSDQKAITEKNRQRKRIKHVKRYPNDLQTAKLLKG